MGMKYLKNYEGFDEDESTQEIRERLLSDVAIYLENMLNMTEDEVYKDCLYSDLHYDSKKIIYF